MPVISNEGKVIFDISGIDVDELLSGIRSDYKCDSFPWWGSNDSFLVIDATDSEIISALDSKLKRTRFPEPSPDPDDPE